VTDPKHLDGAEVLSRVSGLPRPEVDAIWVKVKANKAVLDACTLHDFEPTSDRFGAKHRCKTCGGEVDVLHSIWYRKGLEHGRRPT
jgi:hypothetical protein